MSAYSRQGLGPVAYARQFAARFRVTAFLEAYPPGNPKFASGKLCPQILTCHPELQRFEHTPSSWGAQNASWHNFGRCLI